MGTRIRDKRKEWSKRPAYRKAYEALAGLQSRRPVSGWRSILVNLQRQQHTADRTHCLLKSLKRPGDSMRNFGSLKKDVYPKGIRIPNGGFIDDIAMAWFPN